MRDILVAVSAERLEIVYVLDYSPLTPEHMPLPL